MRMCRQLCAETRRELLASMDRTLDTVWANQKAVVAQCFCER
jgi:hypothetical protein